MQSKEIRKRNEKLEEEIADIWERKVKKKSCIS